MSYDNPDVRRAYVQGARDTYESAVVDGDPRPLRAIEEWLGELERWQGGDPPPPPHLWAEQD